MTPRFARVILVATSLMTITGCLHPQVVGVAPLQLFGAAPEVMPALSFEPVSGTLGVSARRPVYVTVVEIDPRTQQRRVAFPGSDDSPVRVEGNVELDLALERVGDSARITPSSVSLQYPSRGVLVIASVDSLLVRSSGGRGAAWELPSQMPDAWAAVYVWPAPRVASPR